MCDDKELKNCDDQDTFRVATMLITKYLSSDDVRTLVEMNLIHRLEKLE